MEPGVLFVYAPPFSDDQLLLSLVRLLACLLRVTESYHPIHTCLYSVDVSPHRFMYVVLA
jgi:hypothetical protein